MSYSFQIPPRLQTTVHLPLSKSICNRALIIGAQTVPPTVPPQLSDCDDTRTLVRALADRPDTIDAGAAGTAMRFLTAYLASTAGTHTLTGTPRMKCRPIKILVDALRSLGADIQYVENDGFPPLLIKGKSLAGGSLELPGNISSQYVSALLLIAPNMQDGLRLRLTDTITSLPYINLTLSLMQTFGAVARWVDEATLEVQPAAYRAAPFVIESDWSAASYWYAWVALSSGEASVFLSNLSTTSRQGDARVRQFFEPLGVQTRFADGGAYLCKGMASAEKLCFDLTEQPDLAQTLVVACAMLRRPFHFTGLHTLKIKETDRLTALVTELAKLGCRLEETGNSELRWNGVRIEVSSRPHICTYDDHRMAMAFAPCALVHPDVCIDDPQVVSKSYPSYWDDLRKAGIVITES